MSEELTANKQEPPKRNYWLHRITGGRNAFPTAKMLLENGYLSIGWADFSCEGFVKDVQDNGIDEAINNHAKSKQENSNWAFARNRWSLWRFIKEMKAGDYVVVPTWKTFSIYEIEDDRVLTNQSFSLKECSKELPKFDGTYLRDEQNNVIDLGFYRKVKEVKSNILREDYADPKLVSRLKMRQTNALLPEEISKLVEETKQRCITNQPINLHKSITDEAVQIIFNKIKDITTPEKLEHLIQWYFESLGARSAKITAKNILPKEKGDVDILAYFDTLKLVVMVQAKRHDNTTDKWAVEQIILASENLEISEDYSKVLWVISTCEEFSEDTENLACEKDVRLINGYELARMILEKGIGGLNL